MLSKILLIAHTVRYLKWQQVVYQIKNKLFKVKNLEAFKDENLAFFSLNFNDLPVVSDVLHHENNNFVFTFLNLTHTFEKEVYWNEQKFAKLWNYNLQYMDCLRQYNISNTLKFNLLKDIHQQLYTGNLPLEPYPVSLRILNTIRFLSSLPPSEVPNSILQGLKAQCNYLDKHLEYHILANHLLENCFAMHMAAYFFKNQKWIDKYTKLLSEQLQEQILKDGAHYELSPMYHQIILFRVIEVLDYLPQKNPLHPKIYTYAKKMLDWIHTFSFTSGDFAHVNDSTNGIAFSVKDIMILAKNHGIFPEIIELNESSYRKICFQKWEAIVDIGGIAPKYQPGHAHADTFNFVVNTQNKCFIVDTGISTYNIGNERTIQRSTKAHNTIVVNNQNSSQIWSGFRVAKRAQVNVINDAKHKIVAQHNGYKNNGIIHQRTFAATENCFTITDELLGDMQGKNCIGHLHFSPEIDFLNVNSSEIICNNGVKISFENCSNIEIKKYKLCLGYNSTINSNKIVYNINSKSNKVKFNFI
jgi:hypothetical protein